MRDINKRHEEGAGSWEVNQRLFMGICIGEGISVSFVRFLLIVNTSLLSASLRGTGCNTNLKKFIILRFSNYIL